MDEMGDGCRQSNAELVADSKKKYSKPTLTEVGSVDDVTKQVPMQVTPGVSDFPTGLDSQE